MKSGLILLIRQFLCRHKFDLADLIGREAPDGDVKWPCSVCGKVYTAHCGLSILTHGTPTQDKWKSRK